MTTAADSSRRHHGVRVLVGYAGVHGSTRSIAERIADRLREQGVQADALPVDAVNDPREYDAFVVGSAVHDMTWLPPGLAFVHRHKELLVRRGAWLFSVGMPAALRGPWKTLGSREEDYVIGGLVDELHPRGHRLFSGAIEPEHLTRAGRMRFRAMGLRYGDYRDRSAVDTWSREIAHDVLGRSADVDDAGHDPGGR